MKKNTEVIEYNIEAHLGNVKESETSNWTKSVLKIIWGDNPPSIDIRNINTKDNRIGKGISLSNEETDKLVDILLNNDFGSIEAISEALDKKKSVFSTSDEIEDALENDNKVFEIKL